MDAQNALALVGLGWLLGWFLLFLPLSLVLLLLPDRGRERLFSLLRRGGPERVVRIDHLDQPVEIVVQHLTLRGYVRFLAILPGGRVGQLEIQTRRRADLVLDDIFTEVNQTVASADPDHQV